MEGGDLETDVDVLVSLVKEKGKVTIDDSAKILKVPVETVQKWVDFLLEEQILGIEYKFVTPYLFFNKYPDQKITKDSLDGENEDLADKEVFFDKAKKRGLSLKSANDLWQKFLQSNMDEIREHFYEKAKLRNLSEQKIHQLWARYIEYLQKVEE